MKNCALLLWLLPLALAGCGGGGSGGGGGWGGGSVQNQPVSFWIEQLKSPDADRRRLAEKVLIDTGKENKDAVLELVDKLKDSSDKPLRIAICKVLERIEWRADQPETVKQLKVLFRDDDQELSLAAARALRKVNEDEAAKLGIPKTITTELAPRK